VAAVDHPEAQKALKADLCRAEQISCVYHRVDAQLLTEEKLPTADSGFSVNYSTVLWVTVLLVVLTAAVAVIVVICYKKQRSRVKSEQEPEQP